jgi:RNA polymerase sigma factor (sigma-70 family)
MATSQMSKVMEHLRRTVLLREGAGLTDGQLLEVYLRHRDEAALAVLVRRHGAMVWGVCRRVLRNYHDAEDAFQATFLVFVRKATSIAAPELLANWLYGVAHQTALKARATTAKRGARERQVTEMPEPAVREKDLWNDLKPLLDQALSRLPDKYRVAIIRCDLEGETRKEAARQLGVPEGTLAARLARGRKMLAQRLARHGLAVSSGLLAALLAENTASALVPIAVECSTIKATSLFASGQVSAAGLISIKAVALADGVLRTMFLAKLKIAIRVVMGMALLGVGCGLYPTFAAVPPEAKQEAASPPPSEFGALGEQRRRPAKDGQGEKKISLPKGPAPVQVLASLDKDGKLVVRAEQIVVLGVRVPRPELATPPAPVPEGSHPGTRVLVKAIGGSTAMMSRPHDPIELAYDLQEVRVLDTKGEEIDNKDLAKLLKNERVAVAVFGDQPPDPLHLRILKEGTLVFILPLPPPDKLPLPDARQALYRKLGPAMVSVLFLRKQASSLASGEQ